MIHKDYSYKDYGFLGHMACPDKKTDSAVIVIMGGEKGIFPGIKIAERFADYGFCGLAVSLFGGEGILETVNQIPLEMFENALNSLKDQGYKHINVYGMSMGSIFAVLTSIYYKGIENVILVSPTHVPFEGTTIDKKHMTGKSIVTYNGKDINFIRADLTKYKPSKYLKSSNASHKVMGMWQSYYEAYQNTEEEKNAMLPFEKMDANILLISGDKDEAWPSSYSINKIKDYLNEKDYKKNVKAIIYPNVGHLTGMMPNKQREKLLFKLMPIIGIFYKTLGSYKKENLEAFNTAEKEIISFIKG